jgi:capsular exopolysaccharide synthesis family protein
MAQHPSAPQRQATRGRTSQSHLSDYLRVVYKRRWVAAAGFLLVFLSGVMGSVRTVPIYEARTQLIIEKDARRATSLNTVLEDRDSWYQDDFYPTQYKILQSRALALRTAQALETKPVERVPEAPGMSFSLSGLVSGGVSAVTGIFSQPAPPAPVEAVDERAAQSQAIAGRADRVLGGLSVAPIKNSRLVDVKFRSPDPQYAATVANELANQYILQTLEFRQSATTEANDFLTTRLEEQRRLVEESDRKLQEYKERTNASSVDGKQNIVVQKLNALNAELVQARIERMDKEAVYNTLTDLQQKGEPLDAFPAIMASDIVRKLKTDVAAKESERARMSATFGPAYQPMRDLTRQIDAMRADLNAEIQKVVGSIRAEFQAAKAKEDGLARSLASQQQESLGFDRKMLDYAALEREAVSNRQLYETLLTRTKETGAAGEYRGSNIQVLDKAEVPAYPILPQTRRDLMVAGCGGLLLALGLVFAFEYFDSRLKTPDEVKTHLQLPFLGMIPAFAGDDHGGEAPLLHTDTPPAFSESIRALRTAVLFSTAEEGARTLVVTSTGPSEGKTMVSSSLAIALAQAGQKTVIVDADMRRPRMHEALGRSQEPGLSNVLVGESSLADAARPTTVQNLSVLAAGHIPPNPAELLGSQRYLDVIADLKKRFDWVIIDAPPVMPVTDAAIVSNTAGGVLFVIGAEMTPRQNAQAALEQLRGANARFVGAVLNRVHIQRHSYYYAPYYRKEYGKYYQRSANQA